MYNYNDKAIKHGAENQNGSLPHARKSIILRKI